MEIKVKAAAKINLLLDLTAALDNGYHSIFTVMQSVGLFDTVTVRENNSGSINVICLDPHVPKDENNTVWKASESFFSYTKIENKGVDIKIEKIIPENAGLAGGSADAAAVIKALDILYNTNLKEKELLFIAEKVGADVPFCFLGGARLCLNKGEITAPLPPFPDYDIIIVKPDQGISTKTAYENFDAAKKIRHPDNYGFLYSASIRDFDSMCAKAANVFEQVVEVHDRVKIKAVMRNFNANLAMMTGSGAAIFGIFKNSFDCLKCYNNLRNKFNCAFITKPVEKGLFIV